MIPCSLHIINDYTEPTYLPQLSKPTLRYQTIPPDRRVASHPAWQQKEQFDGMVMKTSRKNGD